MDTTDKYIEMCEKAKEIQSLKSKPSFVIADGVLMSGNIVELCCGVCGDRNYHIILAEPLNLGEFISPDNYYDIWWIDYKYKGNDDFRTVWLLMQDQLQRLINWRYGVPFEIINILYDEIHNPNKERHEPSLRDINGLPNFSLETTTIKQTLPYEAFTSMEQLWLAFVMKHKYNKIWKNNDWVTKGECEL